MREWYAWGYFQPGTLVRPVEDEGEEFVDIMSRPEIVEAKTAVGEGEQVAEQEEKEKARPEPEPEPEPRVQPEPEPEPQPKQRPQPEPEPEPEPKAEPEAPPTADAEEGAANAKSDVDSFPLVPILVCLLAAAGGVLAASWP